MSQLFQFLDQTGKPLSLRNLRLDGMTVSPHCMELGIENLRSLQSLHIYKFSSNGMEHPIWDILRKERIYIKSLSTDAADDSLLRYLSSFHGMRKFSLIKYSFLQFDPISLLKIMIPHHVESLTELSVLEGLDCQSKLIWSENLVNLLSSFKNLQYFGVQLHVAACYISIIVRVFCNVNILFITLTRSSRDLLFRLVQKYFLNFSASISILRRWYGLRNARFCHQPRSSMMPLLNTNLTIPPLLLLKLNVKGGFIFHAMTRQQGPFPISPIDLLARTFK